MIIQVDQLSKSFNVNKKNMTTAVENVSFDLDRGETLGVVGESGSGKSTIARLLTGLISPDNGEIYIDGDSLKQLKKNPKVLYGKIQMVFQNPVSSFDPRRTIGAGIGEALINRGFSKTEVRSRVAELLEMCDLDAGYAKKYPHEVSGGQCQRAAIARALAIDPDILICDEATSSLDVTVQKQIIDLLQEIKNKRGLSIIFISHNLALVNMFCDRVIVMKDGRIVESGITTEVIKNPKDEYTKALVKSILL